MVQCEMCGTESASPDRVKIEGAELTVCADCAEFGTEVETSSSSASTKYSTDSAASTTTDNQSSSGRSSTGGATAGSQSGGRPDMYGGLEELAQNYDDRLRSARESAGLSQDELAQQLNEKASLIGKLERGDTLPSDNIQSKLERALDIDLTTGSDTDETEWESETSTGGYTLGDVVERKD